MVKKIVHERLEADEFSEGCEIVKNLLKFIGENSERDGLKGTPARVVRSWKELYSGYSFKEEDIGKLLTEFDCDYDELVLLKQVEFYSTCVVGSTFVETPKGRIPIQYLKTGDWVYSFNIKTGLFDLEKCINPRITRKKSKLVKVYCDKDTVLCTSDHKFLTYEKGWVKAKNLSPGDQIVALNKTAQSGLGVDRNKVRPKVLNPFDKSKAIPEHRMIYTILKGDITSEDHIHHIDGDSANNDPTNLGLTKNREHIKIHAACDGRGKREAKRWANMSEEEWNDWEKRRKAGLNAVHEDPIKRKKMLEKRKKSLIEYWKKIKSDKKLYKNRTKKMGRQYDKVSNHKVLSVIEIPWKEDVWCMDIPKNHNFIANGMVVHNCEHHLQPFYGVAHIGYIPNQKVVGISKLARLLEIYSRRLQIQERICVQITKAMMKYLQPKGAACILQARHLCLACRGVQKQNSIMVTSSLEGCFKEENSNARIELLELIKL